MHTTCVQVGIRIYKYLLVDGGVRLEEDAAVGANPQRAVAVVLFEAQRGIVEQLTVIRFVALLGSLQIQLPDGVFAVVIHS